MGEQADEHIVYLLGQPGPVSQLCAGQAFSRYVQGFAKLTLMSTLGVATQQASAPEEDLNPPVPFWVQQRW